MIPTNTVIVIERRTDTGTDDWGNPIPGYAPSLPTAAWLTQTGATEVTEGADVAVSDWQLGLPNPATEIGNRDRVREPSSGKLFEVVGEPHPVRRPGGQAHHVEARLRLVV